MRSLRVLDLDFLVKWICLESGFWFGWWNVRSGISFFSVLCVGYYFFEKEVVDLIFLCWFVYDWVILLFFELVENILLVFFVIEKCSEARWFFNRDLLFLNELGRSQWVIELLDVVIFAVDFTQKSCTASVSHIIFNVNFHLLIVNC